MFSVQDAISSSQVLTRDRVVEMFPDVLNDGVGTRKGKYQIRLNKSAEPAVQHTPQRDQVAFRDKVKETLDELHASGVIELVTKPVSIGYRFQTTLFRLVSEA